MRPGLAALHIQHRDLSSILLRDIGCRAFSVKEESRGAACPSQRRTRRIGWRAILRVGGTVQRCGQEGQQNRQRQRRAKRPATGKTREAFHKSPALLKRRYAGYFDGHLAFSPALLYYVRDGAQDKSIPFDTH